MATLRSSNLDRAAYRAKCRKKLSEHLLSKLGLSIEPGEVRLITRADDPYAWRTLPEKKHLFEKQLSKHSIGAYRELCRGNVPGPETSFTARIEQLQSENRRLTIELDAVKGQAIEEIGLKEVAAAETSRWKAIAQAAEMDKQMRQQEAQKLQGMLDFFRQTTSKSVVEFLNRLKLDLSLPTSG